MKRFWSRQPSNYRVGITLSDAAVAMAVINMAPNAKPCIEHCELLTEESGAAADLQPLSQLVSRFNLESAACYGVLPSTGYELLLVEAPQVPEAELRDAVYWRLKDLISFPIEEAAVDIFQLPSDGNAASKSMIYAVATQKKVVQQFIDIAEQLKLNLCAIDIPELCCRNLLGSLPASDRGIAFMNITQGLGQLFLIKNGYLYLSRSFSLDYAGGLLDELPEDKLILELQRSFDYYERQMGQIPPAEIVFNGENITLDKISQAITSSFAAKCRIFTWDHLFSLQESISQHLLPLCLPTLGAVLRKEAS